MVKQTSKTPALRFPEFSGEWEENKLSTLATIKYGKDQKLVEVENGKYPILGTGGEMGRASQFLYDKPSVLIGRKGTIDKPKLIKEPFWTVDTLFYTEIAEDVSPEWFYNKALTINWYLYNEASGVPSLSAGTISRINIYHPTLPEQEKIADFLGAVDEKIQQLTRKKELLEQYKKGVMQRIFSQELRFKDDNGNEYPDWEERYLYDVLTEHGQKSSGAEEVFSVSVHKGLINQIEHLGRSYAAKDTNNYNLVKPNDIVYTKSPTGDFPLGIIKQSRLKENVIVSPLYGIFTPETPALGYMLHVYFESPISTANYLASIIQKGAKNTINITNTTFLSKALILPVSKPEQQKIADFLSALDEKIHLATTQLDKAKVFKKGLLQKMFV